MYCGDDKYTESWFCLIQAWKDEPETEDGKKQGGKEEVKTKTEIRKDREKAKYEYIEQSEGDGFLVELGE